MAGSHEVRGSIPLGSTTDTRGARRRRRAPLFFASRDGKEGPRGAIVLGRCGRPACSRPPSLEPVSLIRGRRRGPAPLSRSPGLVAPFKRPDGKRALAAHGHREVGARACATREEAAPDPFGRIEAINDRAGTHSALGRLGPAELEGADWPREDRRPKAAQKPSTESGQIQIQRRRVREPRHRRPAGGARRPEAPLPRGRPVRRRGHRARQQGPEEGARLSAGVRRPRPAPPRARPTRPAARRGEDASGAGLHGPRGVRECGIVPVKNA